MKIFDEVITSRQNRIAVEAVKLCEKKARESAGLFRFDGVKLFEEALEKRVAIKRILVCESKSEGVFKKLNSSKNLPDDTAVCILSDGVFAKVSEESAPEGIICIAEYPSHHVRKASESALAELAADKSRHVMMLESVRDPGNMGTIMRSAAAFGVDTLVISRDCADIYNPKTVRAAMGALFKMRIFAVEDVAKAVSVLREHGRRVYAAALDKTAVRLDETEFSKGDTVIIGNEGHGLSPETIKACTQSLYIPMEEGSESLNAAIAASVIMWNMYKN